MNIFSTNFQSSGHWKLRSRLGFSWFLYERSATISWQLAVSIETCPSELAFYSSLPVNFILYIKHPLLRFFFHWLILEWRISSAIYSSKLIYSSNQTGVREKLICLGKRLLFLRWKKQEWNISQMLLIAEINLSFYAELWMTFLILSGHKFFWFSDLFAQLVWIFQAFKIIISLNFNSGAARQFRLSYSLCIAWLQFNSSSPCFRSCSIFWINTSTAVIFNSCRK